MTTYNTNQFSFNKDSRVLTASIFKFVDVRDYLGGFPSKFDMVSGHTGRTVKFVMDEEAAIRAEFWDGEMCVYKSNDTDVRVVLTRE